MLGIAATPLVQHLVTRALAMAHEHDSDCELMIEEMATPRQPLALRDARIDIGLCHASPVSAVHDRGIRREYLLSDRLSCALLPGAHPLVSRTAIRLADLTDLPFVFISRQFQPPLYDAVYSAFADEDFEPRIFEGTHDMLGTIWSLVAEGRGWALGFESQRDEPPPGCAVVPVENLSLRWGVDLIHREDESRTTVLLVLDMIRDAARARRHRAAVPALRSVTGVTSRA